MKLRSSTTTADPKAGLLPLIHPGEILLEEFLRPLALSQYRLAHAINVPPRRVNEIVHGKRAVSPDTAVRLGRFFGTTAQFWMNLQTGYDLRRIERESGERIARDIVPLDQAG